MNTWKKRRCFSPHSINKGRWQILVYTFMSRWLICHKRDINASVLHERILFCNSFSVPIEIETKKWKQKNITKQCAKIFIQRAIKMQNGRASNNPSLPLDEFVQDFHTHVINQVSDIEGAKKCELGYLRRTLLQYDLDNPHDLLPEGQDTYYGKLERRHRKFLDDKEDDDDLCLPSRCADLLIKFFRFWLTDTQRTYTRDLAEMRRLVGEFTQCEEWLVFHHEKKEKNGFSSCT